MASVLLDTNVIVSGLLSKHGNARRLLDAWHERRFTLVTGARQLLELEDVLTRPKLQRLRVTAAAVELIIGRMRDGGLTDVANPSPITVRDPKDEYLIAMAIAGKAEYLVTGDNDLLSIGDDLRPLGVEVVTPGRFVEILGG